MRLLVWGPMVLALCGALGFADAWGLGAGPALQASAVHVVQATGQPVDLALDPGLYEVTAAGSFAFRAGSQGVSDAARSWEFGSGQRCLPWSLFSVNHLPPWAQPLTPDLPSNVVLTTLAFYGPDPAACDEATHTYRAHLACLPPGCRLHHHVHDSSYHDNVGSIRVTIATVP